MVYYMHSWLSVFVCSSAFASRFDWEDIIGGVDIALMVHMFLYWCCWYHYRKTYWFCDTHTALFLLSSHYWDNIWHLNCFYLLWRYPFQGSWNLQQNLNQCLFDFLVCAVVLTRGCNHTPRSLNEVEGGILVSPFPFVCMSICWQNRVRSVSSTIPIGSIFGKLFKFVTLTLSCFDLESNMTW